MAPNGSGWVSSWHHARRVCYVFMPNVDGGRRARSVRPKRQNWRNRRIADQSWRDSPVLLWVAAPRRCPGSAAGGLDPAAGVGLSGRGLDVGGAAGEEFAAGWV